MEIKVVPSIEGIVSSIVVPSMVGILVDWPSEGSVDPSPVKSLVDPSIVE